jgi:hypothetical protein
MQSRTASRWTVPSVAVAILLILGACTTTTVTPEFVQPATHEVKTVAIGDIAADDELWELYVAHFRSGLVAKLKESKVFAEVLETAPADLPSNAVLITGKLTEIDKGSKAARWIIGFGAGRAKARGDFQISDPNGLKLAKFQSRKAYSGGAGIGGADFVDMEDLVQELGEETAGSVIRWSQGEPLEPPKKK